MERNYSDLAGRAMPAYAAYLGARAAGGAALLFTEASYVRQDSKARLHQAGMHDDSVLPGLQSIARVVHEHGALLGVEVNHAGRVVPSSVSQRMPVGPSPVACTEIGGEVPRELTPAEIDRVVVAYADAARRAVRGGADVISVHGAHGYLIGQFVSPRSNHRTDRYAVPTVFLDEVLVAVRDAIGDVPLFLRWSAFEGLPGGLDTEASLDVLLDARLDLVDVVDLSAGTYGAGHWITPSGEVEEGYLAQTARRYRRETGRCVSMAGRITSPDVARRLVSEGATDLVSVARALHADPAWARHATTGSEPRPCISCNQGCADVVFTGQPLWCTANPSTGREGRTALPRQLPEQRTDRRARIVVAGSGPAGLQAAHTLAAAGWPVTIHEKAGSPGGQLAATSRLRAKPQFARLLAWYLEELRRFGAELLVGSEINAASSLDHVLGVVDATGGTDYVPPVTGDGIDRLIGARAWLARGIPEDAGPVTVWGADRCGTYAADHLQTLGWSVTIIGPQTRLAPDAGARERLPAVERLGDGRTRILLGSTVESVGVDELLLSVGGQTRTISSPGPVLVSLGTVPVGLAMTTAPTPTVVAGEAAGEGPLDVAIASGDRAARQLLDVLAATRGAATC